MTAFTRVLPVIIAIIFNLPSAHGAETNWIDSVSVTVGKDDNSNATDIYRLGLQNKWDHTWFNDGAWFVGGYWDVSLAYWDSDNDTSRSLYDLGLTPILRLQRDTELSNNVSPFSEVGVGGHLLTDQEIGERDLSSRFQFGTHLGLGLGFGDKGRYELMYRYQHLSNANTKSPNQAINLHLVSFGYAFE
jgi:lipid A 3-O-deacylase